ncbi:super-infection exclusion protein B [Serratia symbiotica]|uniref:Putative Superinfection exclusion protein B n=1 Tax=Serratia symbiotica SCt-VLC TaxID=1347341 RepID=A0A068RAD4_9GAMM|nr:super-infection exclusion protein B [Serratia symbiotica]CDG47648.1 Putative Superinfection exclusion protein B [Serratia symbiotica SCt-VLC]
MDNKWLQDIFRFFLRDIDIKRLMHMPIIFVILIVLLPDSFKQAIGAHNPEFLPNYAIYYVAVFCFSFLFSSITSFTTHSVMVFLVNFARSLKIMSLSAIEKQCLRSFLQNGCHVVYARNHNSVIELLAHKKILEKTHDQNCSPDMEGYALSSEYSFHVVKHLS